MCRRIVMYIKCKVNEKSSLNNVHGSLVLTLLGGSVFQRRYLLDNVSTNLHMSSYAGKLFGYLSTVRDVLLYM